MNTSRQRRIIGMDCDGVLFDFNSKFIRMANEKFGINCPLPSNTFPDKWHYINAYTTSRQRNDLWASVARSYDFWATLPVYPWTGQFLKELEDENVYFITSRMGVNPRMQTELAIERAYGQFIGHSHCIGGIAALVVNQPEKKIPIIDALGITHFVDDKWETCVMAADETNAKVAVWDQPWNRDKWYPRVDRIATVNGFKEWLNEGQ